MAHLRALASILLLLFQVSTAAAQCIVGGGLVCPAAAASGPTTFDPGSNTNATLSNGNLTTTHTTTTVGGSRSISYKSAGKFCVTYTVTASHGITDAPAIIASNYAYSQIQGNSGTGVYWWGNNGGGIVSGGGGTGFNIGALVQGDVINVAVDANNANTWWQRNGGQWNGNGTSNPATNTNGAAYSPVAPVAPAWGWSGVGSAVIGDNATINTSGTACAGQLPAGFTAGWPQ